MWDTNKIEQVYRAALLQAGLAEPITREGSMLTLAIDGYSIEIGLEPAEWLSVTVRLFAINSAVLSNNHFLMPPGGPEALFEAVSKTSQAHSVGRLSVHDHGHAVVGNVAMRLFGSGDPAFAQNGVTIFNVDWAREALCLGLSILSGLIGALFKTLKLQRPAPRFHPPGWRPSIWETNSTPLVKGWLDHTGVRAHEGRANAAGTISFGWGEPPAAVSLDTHCRIIRATLTLFEYATCPEPMKTNALYGAINWSAGLTSNDFNATRFGPCFGVSTERGVLSTSLLALVLHRDELGVRPNVLSGFPAFLDLLREETATLLSALRIPAFPGPTETARRKRTAQAGNMQRRERMINHRWQRAAAREVVENVTGQRGWVLSGYSIPAPNGPVEIDNILVSESGLFVLDCWSCSGVITGSLNGEWTERHLPWARTVGAIGLLPVDRVLQHAFALKNAIERSGPQPKLFVRGIVLFPDNADLRLENIPVDTLAGNVPSAFRVGALVRALNDPASGRSLSPEQVDILAGVIEQLQ